MTGFSIVMRHDILIRRGSGEVPSLSVIRHQGSAEFKAISFIRFQLKVMGDLSEILARIKGDLTDDRPVSVI